MSTFDSLAPTYDTDFTHSIIGTHLRNRVHTRLLELWQAGDHILELGCGTGEDAHFLGTQGIHVTATDASPKMLAITQDKTKHLKHTTIQKLDLSDLPDNGFATQYDGVLSNFGALNCISDWKPLAQWLSNRVKSGGTLTFAIMSPYCLWETAWHGLHIDYKTATRRWESSASFTPDANTHLNITYPTIRRIIQDFSPHFQRTRILPLGLFLPPSDVYPVIEKRATLLKWLTQVDDTLGTISQLALFADHYWIEFMRV
jgi:SAM-dependent methyltransferase